MDIINGYPQLMGTNTFLYPHVNEVSIGIIVSVPVATRTRYTLI